MVTNVCVTLKPRFVSASPSCQPRRHPWSAYGARRPEQPDLAIVCRICEAMIPAYDQANDLKVWEQAQTISVLRGALARLDSSAYLVYRVRNNNRCITHTATEYGEVLAFAGCAADALTLTHTADRVGDRDGRPLPT